ncbi:MAG: paraquat-inducible protein A [Kofleriaceae bacterium]
MAIVPDPELVVCEYCDTVHRRVDAPRGTLHCVTCGAPIEHSTNDVNAMLAITLTAVVGFIVGNVMPLLTLRIGTQHTRATLWAAISASYDQQLPVVATALTFTLIIAPVFELGLLLFVLVPLVAGTRPRGFSAAMWLMRILRPWRMVEVFFLGVIVAFVKLTAIADATPNLGLFGIGAMTLALASLATFDHAALWHRASEVSR